MGGGRAAAAGDEHRRQFAKGSVVEVAGDKGVRYLATVISTPWISWSSWSPTSQKNPNSNKFFVEYRSLFDHDGCTPLRKHVEIHRVRPLPPPNHATSFRLHDVVEAFYRHGWWTGVITRVLENSRFVVNLRNSQEEIECGLLELRVHQEWIGGTWVLPANKVLPGNKVFTVLVWLKNTSFLSGNKVLEFYCCFVFQTDRVTRILLWYDVPLTHNFLIVQLVAMSHP